MEPLPADDPVSPVLDSDHERVVRCRLKAEEYRTVADQTRSASARATFQALAALSERMAAEAQGRIDAQRALAGPGTIPGGET